MSEQCLYPIEAGFPGRASYGVGGRSLSVVSRGLIPTFTGTIPAVLTDGESWYSAELEISEGRAIAWAINGYEDQATAEIDAARRR